MVTALSKEDPAPLWLVVIGDAGVELAVAEAKAVGAAAGEEGVAALHVVEVLSRGQRSRRRWCYGG